MKKTTKLKMTHGIMTVAASLLAALIGGTVIANSRASFLNNALGTSNYKLVNSGESNADSAYFKSDYASLSDMIAAKRAVSIQLSQEGSVLLKNRNKALPLAKASEKITLWGMNSHTPTLGGMIGSNTGVNADAGQKMYDVEAALTEEGFELNSNFIALYSSDAAMAYARRGFGNTGHGLSPSFTATYANTASYPVGEIPASLYTAELLASADDTAAVVVLSRDSSEAADYNPDMTNGTAGDVFERPLALSQYEKDMIALAKQHSTKVIVLLNADNPMEIDELKNDDGIDAILWTGAPGIDGFLGVADVLSGDANPSGRLTDTYAVNSASSPAMTNFGVYTFTNYSGAESGAELTADDKGDWYVVESESIYVGYKYYETRYEDAVLGRGNATSAAGSSSGGAWDYASEVSYPFGYGLSYTTFEQTLKSVSLTVGGKGEAVVEVKNTGDVSGKSVVELYVQTPYTAGGLEKSAIQLLDFGKTDVLEPNETVTLTIEFDPVYMASYDENAVKANGKQGAWSLDSGDYYFAIGNGAHEALNNILSLKEGGSKDDSLVILNDGEKINSANAKKWTLGSRDIETYSEGVENALQDADLNHFIDNAVEYTTRSDWTKGWKTVTGIQATAEMLVGLTNSAYQLTENGTAGDVVWGANNGLVAANFILLDDNGNYAGVVDFEDSMWDLLVQQITLEEAAKFIEQAGDKDLEALGSIMLTASIWYDGPAGIAPDQLADYTTRWSEVNSDEPTYVSTSDAMAGYKAGGFPTEPIVASTFNKELVQTQGHFFGEDSLWTNSNSIAGPGLNLHRTPYCGRNHEYYSEDSVLTGLMGEAVCKGAAGTGIMMMPKHLAFNHQEMNRSGVATYFTEQAGRENELRAFYGAMANNYAQGVMTAFNRIGSTYSGAHAGVQEQILRNEWGYTGWIVTDMINGADYMNWRDIVLGGGGACLTSTAYDNSKIGSLTSAENMALIAKDYAFQAKMQTALRYFVYNEIASNTMNGITADTRMVYVRTWWQNALIAANVVLGLATLAAVGGYIRVLLKLKKEED